MHILGLLGMTRREYTYPSGLGWEPYNFAETIGGYITAAGIILLLGNLVYSYRRGVPAGPDPWHGPTLEWTIPSPPPDYNFAVIPTVRSAYANWEPAPPYEVLDRGHQQVESEGVDGVIGDVVDMPHESPWPPLLALALSGVFSMLVLGKFEIAGIFGILVLLTLAGWHSKEPEEA
jgi:cytochrome c oxidase subunit 1/cytochrome c oxidase subunit I+III